MRLSMGLGLYDLLRRAAGVAQSTLLQGLVSYWPLNEVSGVRYDAVGGNNLTDNNTVGVKLRGPQGTVASFAAANSESLSKASFVFPDDYTVCGWAKPSNVALQHFFDCGTWPNSTQLALAIQSPVTTLQATISDGSGYVQVASTPLFTVNEWGFFAVSYDSSTKKATAHLNNDAGNISAALGGTANRTPATLYVGNFTDGTSYDYNGALGFVGVWSRILTTEERTALFASGNGLKYADLPDGLKNGLVSYWNLDEQSGVRYDSHGSNDLTDNNTVGSVNTGPLGMVGKFVHTNSENLSCPAPDLSASDWAMTAWVRLDAIQNTVNYAISIEDYTDANKILGALWHYTIYNAWVARFSDGTNGAIDLIPLDIDAAGPGAKWHFIAAWRDGNTGYACVDGRTVSTVAIGAGRPNNVAATTLRLGTRANADWFLKGDEGPVALWSRALSQSEATALFNSGLGKRYEDLTDDEKVGLVSYWNLDEASGIRYDSHGSNDLTDNNTVGSVINAGDAMDGGAASFVAANSESLSVAQTAPLTFTVSLWARVLTAGVDKYGTVFSFKNGVGGNVLFGADSSAYGTSNFVSLAVYDATNWFWTGAWVYPVSGSRDWHHIVATCDNDAKELKVYLDGVQVGTTATFVATPGDYPLANEFIVGRAGTNPHPAGDTSGFDPQVDEVAIWDRVLTADERAELFAMGRGKYYDFS